MAEDALSSFTTLLDTVPTLIADSESILASAPERQNEILFAEQPVRDPSSKAEPQTPHKTASVQTTRSQDVPAEATSARPPSTPPPLLRPQLPHMTASDALRWSQRKRKTFSAASGQQSGPPKYRLRSMVVIYYDGDVQKRFEDLVRTISSTRNNMRKGRTGARMDVLSRHGLASSSGSEETGSSGDDHIQTPPGMDMKLVPFRRTTPDEKLEVFDKVDSLLEKAQALFEKAAHQLLRDGDCSVEVSKAKEHLSEVVVLAKAELPNLQRQAEKAAIRRRRRSEDRQRAENAAVIEKKKHDFSGISALNMPADAPLEVDLEVDDSSGDDDDDELLEININTLRLPARYQMRNTRLTAC